MSGIIIDFNSKFHQGQENKEMTNILIKTMAYHKQARILLVNNTDLVGTICHRPAIRSKGLRHSLGLTVSAASLLAGTLKDRQRLSLSIKSSRSGYKWFADVDWQGNVRGYAGDELLNAPPTSLDELTMAQLIGDRGFIQIVKDLGMYRNVTGITDMPYRNIVDDLSHYFQQSEQTPTHFALHIGYMDDGRIGTSVGILAQLLPGAPDGLLDRIKEAAERLPALSSSELNGEAFCRVPFRLFDDIEVMDEMPVQAFCGCSKEMMLPMLHALGHDELAVACEANESMEMTCQICGNSYLFTPDEIRKLLDQQGGGSRP
jgi:molecular chaperone Hsp33